MTTTTKLDRHVVALPAGTRVWVKHTEAEIEAMREDDRRAGRWCTDDGETILYPHVGSVHLEADTVVTITRRTKVAWDHWTKKPVRLTEGFASFQHRGVSHTRVVLFQRRRSS